MKVGLISDVHSNLIALETVLDDMPDVDELICLGDTIGYNPWPAKCVELVREHADTTVIGNHGLALLNGYEGYRGNQMAYQGLKHADDQLTDEQKEWLASLPEETLAANGQFRVVHSHPDPKIRWNINGYVYPSDFPRMNKYTGDVEKYDSRIIALGMGHTHVQHYVDLSDYDGEGIAVNPGSVGQPRDDDPRAAYATLDLEQETCTLHRVEYDIEEVQEAITDHNLPSKTAHRLEQAE